jgi:3',5'-cyclic AMP phosphodiesterase CpdA
MSTFALISDPHVTVPNPQTGWMLPRIQNEPTMYGESVDLLQAAIDEINAIPDLDFVLVGGDLTKDSERYNHDRARELLSRFRKPVYCVPGNHDQPRPPELRAPALLDPDAPPLAAAEFPHLYRDFGFTGARVAGYSCDPSPDVHLVALCSPKRDEDRGYIDAATLAWLDTDLAAQRDPQRHTIVMLHHSIVDHVPGESVNPTFSWFHVENAPELKAVLDRHGVRLTFTGHLHIQDVKEENGLYNIVTSSLAGYPNAYRVMRLHDDTVAIQSRRLTSIPSIPDLQAHSRRFVADTFVDILTDMFTKRPFSYARDRAHTVATQLREWWPSLANGDGRFAYTAEELGDPALAAYVNSFSDGPPPDNDFAIDLSRGRDPSAR